MTAKEKAKELVGKYVKFKLNGRYKVFGLEMSKICALIAVDEVMNNLPLISEIKDYWEEVKQEIEKL